MSHALKFLSSPPALDGTRGALLESMKKAGIDYSLALPLANTPENVRGVNRWAQINNKAPIFLLGSVHPRTSKPAEMIKQIAGMGLKGIKMHPEYQDFCFEEESLYPIWEACIKHDLFVLTHTGGDIAFSAPFKSDPKRLKEFHKRFPSLKMVLAHLGSWGMWDQIEEHIVGLPVFLDLAFTLGHIPDNQLIRIIRNHGVDRVLFGTDSPWCDQKQAVDHFKMLNLSKKEKDLILGGNAAKLLDIEVK